MEIKETLMNRKNQIEKEVEKEGFWYAENVWKKECPEIPANAHMSAKKIYRFTNKKSGEVTFLPPKTDLIFNMEDAFYYPIIRYDEETNCLLFAKYSYEKSISSKLRCVFFVALNNKKEVIILEHNAPVTRWYRDTTFDDSMDNEERLSTLASSINYLKDCYRYYLYSHLSGYEFDKYIAKETGKLFKIVLFSGNKLGRIEDSDNFVKFLRHKEPVVRDIPSQRKINELIAYELPEHKADDDVFERREARYGLKDYLLYVDKVKEGLSVLRYYVIDFKDENIVEVSRIYVDDKKSYFCRKNSFGEYVVLTGKLNAENFIAKKVYYSKTDSFSGTILQYYESIIPEIPIENRAVGIWLFLFYPIAEKLYKTGLKNLVLDYVKESGRYGYNKFDTYLNEVFEINDKQSKNMFKYLGINKYQFKRLNDCLNGDFYAYSKRYIKFMKEIFGTSDISSYDNKTFDTVFDHLLNNINDSRYFSFTTIIEVLSSLMQLYSLKTMLNMLPRLKELNSVKINYEYINWAGRTSISSSEAINVYRDYLRIVSDLNDTKNFRPQFNKVEDVADMHDSTLEIYNMKKDAIVSENFEKQLKKVIPLEYEGDDFIVIAPTKPEDLANEGFELHHCVKSYIQKVSMGSTNIMFIRKKDEKDKPFFTVEVSNKKTIEQVHGLCNRNADTEKGLEEFLKKWQKAKKIKLNSINKVR